LYNLVRCRVWVHSWILHSWFDRLASVQDGRNLIVIRHGGQQTWPSLTMQRSLISDRKASTNSRARERVSWCVSSVDESPTHQTCLNYVKRYKHRSKGCAQLALRWDDEGIVNFFHAESLSTLKMSSKFVHAFFPVPLSCLFLPIPHRPFTSLLHPCIVPC